MLCTLTGDENGLMQVKMSERFVHCMERRVQVCWKAAFHDAHADRFQLMVVGVKPLQKMILLHTVGYLQHTERRQNLSTSVFAYGPVLFSPVPAYSVHHQSR